MPKIKTKDVAESIAWFCFGTTNYIDDLDFELTPFTPDLCVSCVHHRGPLKQELQANHHCST